VEKNLVDEVFRFLFQEKPKLRFFDCAGLFGMSSTNLKGSFLIEMQKCPHMAHFNGHTFSLEEDVAAWNLCNAVSNWQNLRYLDLGRCSIESSNMSEVLYAISNCSLLQHLDLSFNYLNQTRDTLNGPVNALCQVLETCTFLRNVTLEYCGFDSFAVSVLSKSLQCCKLMENLSLAGNRFGDTGATYLTQALQKNINLKIIDICDTGISQCFDPDKNFHSELLLEFLN